MAERYQITIIISICISICIIIIIIIIMKILSRIVTVDSDSLHFAVDPVFISISIISILIEGTTNSKYTHHFLNTI